MRMAHNKGNIIVGTMGEDTVDAVNFYILYLSILVIGNSLVQGKQSFWFFRQIANKDRILVFPVAFSRVSVFEFVFRFLF